MAVYYTPGPEGGMVPVEALPPQIKTPFQVQQEARCTRWVEMIKAGMTSYQISAQEGVAAGTVISALRRRGITFMALNGGARRERSRARAAYFNEVYQREGTLDAAGTVLGLTRERVRQVLVQGGYLSRVDQIARRTPTAAQIVAARQDFDSGLGIEALAVKNGVSAARVREMLSASGLNLQQHSGRRRRTFSYEEVRAKYEAGISTETLASEYGKSLHSICRAIVKAGGKLDPYRRFLKPSVA